MKRNILLGIILSMYVMGANAADAAFGDELPDEVAVVIVESFKSSSRRHRRCAVDPSELEKALAEIGAIPVEVEGGSSFSDDVGDGADDGVAGAADFEIIRFHDCLTALRDASATGDVEGLADKLSALSENSKELLLSTFVTDGKTAVQIAAERDHRDLASVLFSSVPLEKRQRIAAIGGADCALALARRAGHLDMVILIGGAISDI